MGKPATGSLGDQAQLTLSFFPKNEKLTGDVSTAEKSIPRDV